MKELILWRKNVSSAFRETIETETVKAELAKVLDGSAEGEIFLVIATN
jgi:hypothetical protein